MELIIKPHASFEAERRGIKEDSIKTVVRNPQQKLPSKKDVLYFKVYIMIRKKTKKCFLG